jgi:hypothetical protein
MLANAGKLSIRIAIPKFTHTPKHTIVAKIIKINFIDDDYLR